MRSTGRGGEDLTGNPSTLGSNHQQLSPVGSTYNNAHAPNFSSQAIPLQNYVSNKLELAKRTEQSIQMTTTLASFVPDYVLLNDFPRITYDTTIDAVAFVCDISGFTALTEVYSLRGKGGTEQLTKTLSNYMSPLVECILIAGGDIIKYAGDAFLAIWRVFDKAFDRDIIRVVDCALYIQEKYGTYFCADVDITIRVKIGIGAGEAYECVVGNQEYHHWVTFGKGVEDASEAEHHCEKGDVLIAPTAWKYLVASDYSTTPKPDGFMKITEIINYPSDLSRGRPLKDVPQSKEKGRQQKIKELRPSVLAAIERKSEQQLRPYVVLPIAKALDENLSLDYLNESRQTSTVFIKLEVKPFDPRASYVDTMFGIVQTAFRYIYNTAKLTGGCLSKIIMFDKGLTYLVVFGLPGFLHSNQSANALEFAHRVKGQIISMRGVSLVSLGVTTGAVYCGLIGHPKRQEYTVIGQMVNKAARLMINYPGCISCDQETVYHSKRPVHFFSLLPQKVLKGIAVVGNIFEYLGPELGEDQSVKSFDYPLINRESELKYFNMILDNAETEFQRYIIAHRLQGDHYDPRFTNEIQALGLWILVVEGDNGMGKSRLLSAFVEESDKRDGIFVVSLTMTMLLKETLAGIRVILYKVFGLDELNSLQEKEEHLKKLAGDDNDLNSGLCLLNEVLNLKLPLHPKYAAADISSRHLYSQHIIATLIKRTWIDKLLIFVIDDAHLMDSQSWEYIFYLSHSPHVVAIVSILRSPNGSPRLDPAISKIIYGPKNVRQLKLAPMDLIYSLPLACQMLEVAAIPVELEKIIVEKSKGNPAWIDQVLSEMMRGVKAPLKIIPFDLSEIAKKRIKISKVDIKYLEKREIELRNKRRGNYFWESKEEDRDTPSLNPSTLKVDEMGTRVQKTVAHPETRICVVKSEVNLGVVPIPGSLKEFLLDQFDDLSPRAQMLLKCAAILGSRFSRAMLIRLIPQYEANSKKFDREFRLLMEKNLIHCASHPHGGGHTNMDDSEKIDCFCRFSTEEYDSLADLLHVEGITDNKPVHYYKYFMCKFMQFTRDSMLDVVYGLMTEDQRKEFHLSASRYLDASIIKCRVHGGDDTAYQFGFTLKVGDIGADHEEALRQAAGGGKRRMSFYAKAITAVRKFDNKGIEESDTSNEKHVLESLADKKYKPTSKGDLNRKLYAANADKAQRLDFNVVTELEQLEKHRRSSKGFLSCLNPFKKSYKRHSRSPTEYDLKIKSLNILNGEGGSDVNSENMDDIGVREVVDLRGCACTNIQLKVCVEMAKHYREAEKYGKCLVSLLDAGECAVATGNSRQALYHLKDAVALVDAVKSGDIPAPEPGDLNDIEIDEEEVNIQVEFLNGLSYFELGIHSKAKDYFLKTLNRFDLNIPSQDDKVQIKSQTLRLVSKLWNRHSFGWTCCMTTADDKIEVDPLVTLKLRIMSYLQVLYKSERRFDMVLLASLYQVKIAEEGSGVYQDVLPAYCSMMEGYSMMGEHKKSFLYEKLALKVLKEAFQNAERGELPPLGLYTASAVFYTVSFIRLLRGDITSSSESAYLSLRIARSMHDNTIPLQVYPRLVISLLLELRISEVVEVLQKLWYTAEEEEDPNGMSLYWTLCLTLLLNTAYPMEPYSACEHFVASFDWGSEVQVFRMYEVQHNIESSVALWNARFNRWELATRWKEKAEKSKPKQISYFSVESQLKLLEAELIFVNHYLETKKYQHFAKCRNVAKQLMTSLEVNTQKIPVLLPRFLHLMAYYCKIRARSGEAEKMLKKAERLAEAHENYLELEWIAHNRIVWAELAIPTIKYFWLEHTEKNTLDWHQSTKVPWANIMFSLPLPIYTLDILFLAIGRRNAERMMNYGEKRFLAFIETLLPLAHMLYFLSLTEVEF